MSSNNSSGPPSAKGSTSSRSGSTSQKGSILRPSSLSQKGSTSRQGSTSQGSSRLPAKTSRLVEPKSSMTTKQTSNIQKTCSGTKMTTTSRMSATTITKLPASGMKQPSFTVPPGTARIRMASSAAKGPTTNVQTTKVKVMGTGLRPTGTAKPTCSAVCAKNQDGPILEPFTQEVERGRPVSPGMYYIPLAGAKEQGLNPEERKLRQKLQKYTPTSLSHWKVEQPNDPFAKSVAPLRKVHPDILSGTFRSARQSFQPQYRNPLLEQRLDPSQPPEHWSLSLREAMSLESGIYEQENPDDGQKETFTVENTVIERQVDAQLPGGSPCGSRSPPRINIQPPTPQAPCARIPSPDATASPQPLAMPLLSPARKVDMKNVKQPEYDHNADVSEITAPRMQSPMGEIDAKHTIYLQRQVEASELGIVVDTTVRGTKLMTPGQAKQIDIVKQDRLPPPRPPSPPLQYVMPPRDAPRGPPALYPVPGGRSPNSSMMAQRGSLEQGYQPPSPPPFPPEYSQTYSKARPASMSGQRSFLGPPKPLPHQIPLPNSPMDGPVRIPVTPSKTPPPPSPINLAAAAPVPTTPEEASLDVLRRLVDEERQDVAASQELPAALIKKLNKLKKKPQSMRVLEETLDQSVPIDEESDNVKSDIIAELMHSQETGVINPSSSPRKAYDQLFPMQADEQSIAVSPAAPAPLNDIMVPVGEADVDAVAVVNEEIAEIVAEAADNKEEIPAGNAYAEAAANEEQLSQPSPPRERKSRENKELEDDAEYIPRGELAEQKAPWDINLGSLEDLVGGKMSVMSAWDNLPSDESVHATAGRMEYVLDVQKPLYHSCVQLRGSQLPAWFPGYYSVLPNVDGCVRLERSPSRAFAAAWHVFAPHQSAEQSEVVFL